MANAHTAVSNSAGHEVLLRHTQGLSRKEVRQLVMIGRESAWHPLPFLFNKPLCNSGRQTAARHGPPAAVQAGCSKPVRHVRSDASDDVGRQTARFVAGQPALLARRTNWNLSVARAKRRR